jgi:hypothetical protein
MKELSYAIVVSVLFVCLTYTFNHLTDLRVGIKTVESINKGVRQ